MRFFNTAGPCIPEYHYMLSPTARLPGLRRIIDQLGYFSIHAPRQMGKTTAMTELARQRMSSERAHTCLHLLTRTSLRRSKTCIPHFSNRVRLW